MDPIKLQKLRAHAEDDRCNVHLNIAVKHYAALPNSKKVRPTKRGERARNNPSLMRYVETAAECLQACTTALDTEVIVFALTIPHGLRGAGKRAFTDLLVQRRKAKPGKKPKPGKLRVGERFKANTAWDLHRLAKGICKERGTLPERGSACWKIAGRGSLRRKWKTRWTA